MTDSFSTHAELEVGGRRLKYASLPALAARGMAVPGYPRSGAPGVVHLGLGAFHRAHQALVASPALRVDQTQLQALRGHGAQRGGQHIVHAEDSRHNAFEFAIRSAIGPLVEHRLVHDHAALLAGFLYQPYALRDLGATRNLGRGDGLGGGGQHQHCATCF